MNEAIFTLYAKPSLIEGLARVFDFSGSLNMYNTSDSPEEADTRAIRADWETVGEDIGRAIETFSAEAKDGPDVS